jgi:histidinol dehydrogenase
MSLRIVKPSDINHELQDPVVPSAREQAAAILKEVQENGEKGLIDVAIRLKDIEAGAPHIITKDKLKAAFDALPADQQGILTRTAAQIRAFAKMQRASVGNTGSF